MLDYLNIKEYPKDKGILLDPCNKEDRLYHNGCYYDLCGMSIQDYINSTLLNCNGGGNNGGSDEPVMEMNTIVFTYSEDNMLTIYPTFAPKTEVTISFSFNGTSSFIKLPVDSTDVVTTPYLIEGDLIVVNNVDIQPLDDGTYKYGDYKIIDKIIDEEHEIYYGLVNVLNIEDDSNIKKLDKELITVDPKTINIVLNMCETDIASLTDEEYYEYCENNGYVTIIAFEKSLWMNNAVVIYNANNDNITPLFDIIRENITLNNKEYVLVSLITDVESSAFVYNNKMYFKMINDNQYDTIEIMYAIKTI
jgi:hypothetical protein